MSIINTSLPGSPDEERADNDVPGGGKTPNKNVSQVFREPIENHTSSSDDEEFVIVCSSDVPCDQSEEITSQLQNQSQFHPGLSSWIGFACDVYRSYVPGNINVFSYFPVGFSPVPALNPEAAEDLNQSLDAWLNEVSIAIPVTPKDENWKRICLVNALHAYFPQIIETKDAFTPFVKSTKMFTREELSYAEGPQSNRRLLLMVLCRDYRAIITFYRHLSVCNLPLLRELLACYNTKLEMQDEKKTFEASKRCTACLLVRRVSICLVVDCLMPVGEEFRDFAEMVSEQKDPAKPSESKKMWQQLCVLMCDAKLYNDVIRVIIECIESCGYHTDIVRNLKEDLQLGRNSFCCICKDVKQSTSYLPNSGENSDAINREKHKIIGQKNGENKFKKLQRFKAYRNNTNKTRSVGNWEGKEPKESNETIKRKLPKVKKTNAAEIQTGKKNKYESTDSSDIDREQTNWRHNDSSSKTPVDTDERKTNNENSCEPRMNLLHYDRQEYDYQVDNASLESCRSSASVSGDSGLGESKQTEPKHYMFNHISANHGQCATDKSEENNTEQNTATQGNADMDVDEDMIKEDDNRENDMDSDIQSSIEDESNESSLLSSWIMDQQYTEPFLNIQIKK